MGREGETGWHPPGGGNFGRGRGSSLGLDPERLGSPLEPQVQGPDSAPGAGPGYLREVEIVWVWEGDVAAQPVVGSSRPLGGVGTTWPEVGGRLGAERLLGCTLPLGLPAAEPTVPAPRGSSLSGGTAPSRGPVSCPASVSSRPLPAAQVTTQPMGHLDVPPSPWDTSSLAQPWAGGDVGGRRGPAWPAQHCSLAGGRPWPRSLPASGPAAGRAPGGRPGAVFPGLGQTWPPGSRECGPCTGPRHHPGRGHTQLSPRGSCPHPGAGSGRGHSQAS